MDDKAATISTRPPPPPSALSCSEHYPAVPAGTRPLADPAPGRPRVPVRADRRGRRTVHRRLGGAGRGRRAPPARWKRVNTMSPARLSWAPCAVRHGLGTAGSWQAVHTRDRRGAMTAAESGAVTGTKDKDYNLIWYV